MQLSPEERRKIYEEEKARLEGEEGGGTDSGGSSTGLAPNVAGMLCYLGAWITGIIFIVIEQKNHFVRFHALQSIITFGIIAVLGTILRWIPVFGQFFSVVIGLLAFFLWILLMVRAYRGEWYKVPVTGDIAESIMPSIMRERKATPGEEPEAAAPPEPEKPAEAPAPPKINAEAIAEKARTFERRAEEFGKQAEAAGKEFGRQAEAAGKQAENYFTGTRAGRVAGYTAAIFWNAVMLVFFTGFYQYIAWYHIGADGGVTRMPLLVTGDYLVWLPIQVTALVINIVAYVMLIIYDKFWLRELVQIVLAIIGVIVIANLVSIFPFDFSVIPNNTAVDVTPIVLRIFLIFIAVGMGVGALVRFVKLIVNAAGHLAD
jgi:uncharacterized membrane protein